MFSIKLSGKNRYNKVHYISINISFLKHDKQDQQGKAAFNERNPHMTKQQEPNGKEPRRTPNIKRTGQRHVNH
jgi:hypothetical protein